MLEYSKISIMKEAYNEKYDDASLKLVLEKLEKELKEFNYLKTINISLEDAIIEQYLLDDYSIIQDINYLKDEIQIKEYFDDIGYDFDCGQGYYTDEITKYIKIGLKYYLVTIKAEIFSSKQNHGDRLYWVESIESVTYKEIEKPKPKELFRTVIKVFVTEKQKIGIMKYLEENNILMSKD